MRQRHELALQRLLGRDMQQLQALARTERQPPIQKQPEQTVPLERTATRTTGILALLETEGLELPEAPAAQRARITPPPVHQAPHDAPRVQGSLAERRANQKA